MSEFADDNGADSESAETKAVAICISSSSDLAFAAAVTFMNFMRIHGVEGFHFRFFSDSKLPRMERIFRNLGADFAVEVYRPPVRWRRLWASKAIAYFSPLVLAKFEGFRLLSSFPTVVWLDYDIVITKPISELWTKAGFDLAFAGSGQPITRGFTARPLELNPNEEGMSAGILAFRNSFPGFQDAPSTLYRLFSEHYSKLYYPEQAIFDLYFLAHPGFIRWALDEKFCAFPGVESPSNAILHAYGDKKFWNGLDHEGWNENYSAWLAAGGFIGKGIESKMKKLGRGLRYITAQILVRHKRPLRKSI